MAKQKYHPEVLEIGQRIAIPRRAAKYAKQLAYTWRKRHPNRNFESVTVDGKTYIERKPPKPTPATDQL
jgi:hypothetical protein